MPADALSSHPPSCPRGTFPLIYQALAALPAAGPLPHGPHSVADISNWDNHRTPTSGFDTALSLSPAKRVQISVGFAPGDPYGDRAEPTSSSFANKRVRASTTDRVTSAARAKPEQYKRVLISAKTVPM